ncbi:unnamed protein product [Mytilus edulis]|uniref:VWFD domain-containing protein n=1 Tax=Mytilus edulis TaxID=6550 RepID=A0A8S3PR21_MYTED|nr:unnamed protein product [Mytilus edulis]
MEINSLSSASRCTWVLRIVERYIQNDITYNVIILDILYHIVTSCRCTGSGDVHYYDFINIKSDIQGICKYTFSRSTEEFPYEKCKWNVEVKNERRGTKTSVSYTKMADVNNLEVSSLAYNIENCGINIRKETRELEIHSEECDIRVLWDGKSRIELDVPKNYSQYAEGICGDCTDGNRFMLRNGTDIFNCLKTRDVLWTE